MNRATFAIALMVPSVGCFSDPLYTEKTKSDRRADPGPANVKLSKNEIAALIKTISDNPSPAHLDSTPSVATLSAAGPDVIPDILPLMESDDWLTRLHAKTILVNITARLHGFERGWPDKGSEERWRAWWHEMGDLHEDADKEKRVKAIQLWKQWCEARRKL